VRARGNQAHYTACLSNAVMSGNVPFALSAAGHKKRQSISRLITRGLKPLNLANFQSLLLAREVYMPTPSRYEPIWLRWRVSIPIALTFIIIAIVSEYLHFYSENHRGTFPPHNISCAALILDLRLRFCIRRRVTIACCAVSKGIVKAL
jgi:hypothetical protein